MINRDVFLCNILIIVLLTNSPSFSQKIKDYSCSDVLKYNNYEHKDSLENISVNEEVGFGIQIRGGLKFAESSSRLSSTKLGFYGGISFIFPLSNVLDIQAEINYSNSAVKNATNRISTKEIVLMLGYKYRLKNFTIKAISGFGIISISGDPYIFNSNKLLGVNLGIGISRKIYSRLYGSLEFRKQWSGSLNTGGGNTFNPFLLNLGIKYVIPKLASH